MNNSVFRTIFCFHQQIIPKSHDNSEQGNKFLDKQKNLPARPVDKLIYFCNSNAG